MAAPNIFHELDSLEPQNANSLEPKIEDTAVRGKYDTVFIFYFYTIAFVLFCFYIFIFFEILILAHNTIKKLFKII